MSGIILSGVIKSWNPHPSLFLRYLGSACQPGTGSVHAVRVSDGLRRPRMQDIYIRNQFRWNWT